MIKINKDIVLPVRLEIHLYIIFNKEMIMKLKKIFRFLVKKKIQEC